MEDEDALTPDSLVLRCVYTASELRMPYVDDDGDDDDNDDVVFAISSSSTIQDRLTSSSLSASSREDAGDTGISFSAPTSKVSVQMRPRGDEDPDDDECRGVTSEGGKWVVRDPKGGGRILAGTGLWSVAF